MGNKKLLELLAGKCAAFIWTFLNKNGLFTIRAIGYECAVMSPKGQHGHEWRKISIQLAMVKMYH